MTNAMALPAPGPGTVRLALTRAALELYGEYYTAHVLFPVITGCDVLISSPERIGVSGQIQKMLKYDEKRGTTIESIGYREHCHTDGTLRVYIRSLRSFKGRLIKLLKLIRYWGQRESFTRCESVEEHEPKISECAQPVGYIANAELRDYVVCFLSELKKGVTWKDIKDGNEKSIELNLFVWPLKICEQGRGNKLLLRRSLNEEQNLNGVKC